MNVMDSIESELPVSSGQEDMIKAWVYVHVFKGNEYNKIGSRGITDAINRHNRSGLLTIDGRITEEQILAAMSEVCYDKNHDLEQYPFIHP